MSEPRHLPKGPVLPWLHDPVQPAELRLTDLLLAMIASQNRAANMAAIDAAERDGGLPVYPAAAFQRSVTSFASASGSMSRMQNQLQIPQ